MVKESAFQYQRWNTIDHPSHPPIFVAYTHFQSLLVIYTFSLELGITYPLSVFWLPGKCFVKSSLQTSFTVERILTSSR